MRLPRKPPRTQASFMLGLNQVLHSAAEAMEVLPDKRKALASLESGAKDLSALRGVLREAEHDRFSGWYDSGRLFGLENLQKRFQDATRELEMMR
jgi:hypothetical protein